MLPSFLETCLRLSRSTQHTTKLRDYTWQMLEPHPDGVMLFNDASNDESARVPGLEPVQEGEGLAATSDWSSNFDVEMSSILDWVDEQPLLGEILVRHMNDLSSREIAKALNIRSPTTVGNRVAKFVARVQEIVAKYELDESRAQEFFFVLLDNIRLEYFPSIEEG
jgi:hypothetical protein